MRRSVPILLFALLLLAVPVLGDTSPVTILESGLNPAGSAYEINPGPDGTLWLSDSLAGEIRAYAADGSTVTVYSGLGRVADARASSGGAVWYVDQATRYLGKLDTAAETVTFWPLPAGAPSSFGTAIDAQGQVWISDFNEPALVRFALDSGIMCTYDFSTLAAGGSPYLVLEGQMLWLSDVYERAVLRFDPQTNTLTRWSLDAGTWDFEAEGLSSDGVGGLWFATASTRDLGRLDLTNVGAPRLLRYAVPGGSGQPSLLARAGEQVWYTGNLPGTLGRLTPDAITPTSYTPQLSAATVEPACATPGATSPAPVAVTHDSPVWTPVEYSLEDTGGWELVSLGEQAFPWGIALQDGDLWAADNGRQVVLRMVVAPPDVYAVYLPAVRN